MRLASSFTKVANLQFLVYFCFRKRPIMKKTAAALLLSFTSSLLFAQVDLGIPTATGKGGVAGPIVKDWECLGINPSNLGWLDNYKFSVQAITFGFQAQSKALDFSTLQNAFMHPKDTFSAQDKQHYADIFTVDNGLNTQTNLNWFAISVHIPKVGGFAMNVRDRSASHLQLNKTAADVIFNGWSSQIYSDSSYKNMTIIQALQGTHASFLHYRELNLAYGTKLFTLGENDSAGVMICGGFGFKYIWGLANLNIDIEQGKTAIGQSSISTKYDINYGAIQNFTPQDASNIFNAVGSGTAFDLGASAVLANKVTFAISATDLGSISWKQNTLVAVDTAMPKLDAANMGINSWDLGGQAKYVFANNGLLNFKPGGAYSTPLPSKLRLGAGWKINPNSTIGIELTSALSSNNTANLDKAFVAVGGEIAMLKVLRVSSGIAGNSTYGYIVPFGIIANAGVMQFGIATNDLLTYLGKSKNPNISFAFGLIRFNIH